MQAALPCPHNPTWRRKHDVIREHFRKAVISWALKVSVPFSNASRAIIVIEDLLSRSLITLRL
jgi:hypothetical protein